MTKPSDGSLSNTGYCLKCYHMLTLSVSVLRPVNCNAGVFVDPNLPLILKFWNTLIRFYTMVFSAIEWHIKRIYTEFRLSQHNMLSPIIFISGQYTYIVEEQVGSLIYQPKDICITSKFPKLWISLLRFFCEYTSLFIWIHAWEA